MTTNNMGVSYTRPDDQENLEETTDSKLTLISSVPGIEGEFDPEEAERAGAFQEDALSAEDAEEAATDRD